MPDKFQLYWTLRRKVSSKYSDSVLDLIANLPYLLLAIFFTTHCSACGQKGLYKFLKPSHISKSIQSILTGKNCIIAERTTLKDIHEWSLEPTF